MTPLAFPLAPPPAGPAGPAPAQPPAPPAEPVVRRFDDPAAVRAAVFDRALAAANALPPATDGRFTLALSGVKYVDPDHVSVKDQKAAVLAGRTVGRRLKGTWTLTGPDGAVVDARTQVVGRVPYVTDRGTVIHNGTQYVVSNQTRLRPGVYVRHTADGRAEAHVNVAPGQGVSHRYRLDPATSRFRLAVGQAELPLVPLLKALGATDRELADAWGPDVWRANFDQDDAAALKKIADRLDPRRPAGSDPAAAAAAALARIALDPAVVRRTLKGDHPALSKAAVLAATRRVLAVSKGEEEPDDRDHLAYQTAVGPEDLFAERLTKDHSRVRRELLRRAAAAGSLAHVPSGALTRQLEQVILGSGLATALEDSNPAEVLDKLTRVTRMGEGGIGSADVVPVESRAVHPSQFGLVDPVRTPESTAAGVDLFFARNARKGADGRLYGRFRDARTGADRWVDPGELADRVVAFPDALAPRRLPAWAAKVVAPIAAKPPAARSAEEREVFDFVRTFDPTPPMVPAFRDGKLQYVKRAEVDLVLPHFEDAFSPLGNLVPAKSAAKGQRAAMAGRMIAQALPLLAPEAPLVRAAVPGGAGRSFEEEYGPHFGAVRAAAPGVVEAVTPDGVTVRHDDGTAKTYETADRFPLNRKTLFHQAAAVRPGDRVGPGHLLAKSNFTDAAGHAAVGANLRTAYLPWGGPGDYEDAVVLSASAAKRLTSSHAYRFGVEPLPGTVAGKAAYLGLFPGKFGRDQLAALGDDGVAKPGTRVTKGDPLVLAARERPVAGTRVHKRGAASHADASVVWEYDDPGVVADVAQSDAGPVVVVTAERPARVGDKLSGRFGDKGIISRVLPDDQMPADKDGRPAELAVSPTGISSRTNPAQLVELVLARVARKTGRPVAVPDFDQVDDLAAWARDVAAAHGVADTEDLTDPRSGRTVKGVPYGERFVMKLHHQGEDKLQARDGGGYDAEGAPTRGGPAGCLAGDTPVLTPGGRRPIAGLVANRCRGPVRTPDGWRPPTDWLSYLVTPDALVRVTFADGTHLDLTRGHAVVRPDGTKTAAAALQPGDEVLSAPE